MNIVANTLNGVNSRISRIQVHGISMSSIPTKKQVLGIAIPNNA
eukprot:CAMPEP_0170889230 /NCGR_PEP_ID=MMETSP0734-20130129/39137_1 /TAXON_ID=186038 /ORGANISM="Fragilariopsis kerguelensis, Strain L26-C5" /LENGTH=43 /DNA_ID= /DNA_START= /DNA_END= /DNA_ORIENTATION=